MSTRKISLHELPANIVKLQTDRQECKITYIAPSSIRSLMAKTFSASETFARSMH